MLAARGLLGGLLALALPLATQAVVDQFIPDDNQPGDLVDRRVPARGRWSSGAFLAYARSIAVVRLSGNLDGVLQAGVWDRLLGLPTLVPHRLRHGRPDLARASA